MEYPMALVVWRDIVSDAEWNSIADAKRKEPMLCTTIGYLINDGDSVTIAHSLTDADTCDYTVIPVGVIVSRSSLEIVERADP